MSTTRIHAIIAIARNGVIGMDGGLPWRIPEDMALFKELTMGKAVIMGRKTWESIPLRFRPLSGRTNLILTRKPEDFSLVATVGAGTDGAWTAVCFSLSEALTEDRCGGMESWIIGGAQVYREAAYLITDWHVTHVDLTPSCEGATAVVHAPVNPADEPERWDVVHTKPVGDMAVYRHYVRSDVQP